MQNNIGLALKVARVAKGLDQQQLAVMSGVSQSLITKIENGHVKNPRPFIKIAIARALELPPELFVSLEEMKIEKKKETLSSMLANCGIDEKIAFLIVNSIRERARNKVMKILSKQGDKK